MIDDDHMDWRERRIRNAMRSGEWLRSQWIARVAAEAGDWPWNFAWARPYIQVLQEMERRGEIESRPAEEERSGDLGGQRVTYAIPRIEYRLVREVAGS